MSNKRNDTGIIVKGVGGLYTIYCEDGEFREAVPRGSFRHSGLKPMVGDRVVIDGDAFGEIAERRNSLVRPKVANVDAVVFVIAAVNPKPDLLLLDKLLAVAREKKIEPILVINKADQGEKEADEIKMQYVGAVKNVFVISLREGEGASDLKNALPAGVTVIAGQSGVGKSTLVNTLLEKSVMLTGDLSKKTEMGKQTTRHSEMFMLPGGRLVIDSPGFSLFDVDNINSGELQYYYPEITAVTDGCRFMDCHHVGEPDCAVKTAVGNGFAPERYKRYVEIFTELKDKEKNKYR